MSTNTATMNVPSMTESMDSTISSIGGSESVGRTLKKSREEKNLSLDEVSRATKIKKEFLIAIEEDKFDALPGQVFTRGFIRAYADFLGMDGAGFALKAVARLDGQVVEPPGSRTRVAASKAWMFVVGGLGVAAAAVAWIAANGM